MPPALSKSKEKHLDADLHDVIRVKECYVWMRCLFVVVATSALVNSVICSASSVQKLNLVAADRFDVVESLI